MIRFVIPWRDQDQLVCHEGFRTHTPVACRAFDEADRNLAIKQKPHNLAGVAAMQRQLDAGMLVEKGSEQPRENVLCDRGGNSKRQFSGDLAIAGPQLSLGFRDEIGNLVGVAEQNQTLPSERDPASSAVEEPHPEIVFECFDLKRYGRLRKEEMFRGLAKVQVRRDGTKHLEAKILQLRHVMIIHETPDSEVDIRPGGWFAKMNPKKQIPRLASE